MDAHDLRQLLDDVAAGAVHPDDAVTRLRRLPFADLGHARVDHHRSIRQGLAEAVYGPGKSPSQCATIVTELLSVGERPILLTRVDDAQAAASLEANPGGDRVGDTVVWRSADPVDGFTVLVATAGTADLVVADECAAVLAAHGIAATRLTDVGVAGVHRLLESVDMVSSADVVVVVAGMEGALASVVGGITGAPIIAVPTSVGYGSSFEGVTALLAMLSSCAAGVSVVGIDNGYGAACAALRLLGVLERESADRT
ncbi:nickel pincer cofactor biosynthesis protein LarB [Actinospongicola halichondriae]|uniref:nickel pincer cofactor biosynthesis protein LarB n=1 Tax=Actinospongicola halichondriae TaxID=3236844 RepID=UPI003D46D34C